MYHQDLKHILVIDIETVACAAVYEELPEGLASFWEKKAKMYAEDMPEPRDAFHKNASLHAEFAKIVSIGIGFFYLNDQQELSLRVKSISNDDEKQLLQDLKNLLEKRLKNQKRLLAHNGKEFDYPFLCRRLLIHGIGLPAIFQSFRNKPWDNPHLDTMEMWRFGDRRNFTSLRLLAHLFGLPPYKDQIDGSMVSGIYHDDKDLDRIAAYCRNDVITTAQVYLSMQNLPIISEGNIVELA
ncbi:MAG: 3'-5' exonuclease [Cytophagales bacterium]|nr:MAG: 3'-5' exonuclease [Cytophagales bacterium]